jgi:hypothetical protein
MKTKNELIKQIRRFGVIRSVTRRASYSEFNLEGDILTFKRNSTGNYRHVNLDQLYEAYRSENHINTVVLKNYLGNWVYSPGLAILIAAGFCDGDGNRIR